MRPFEWDLPYAWPRTPVLATNVVCTSQPLAAQAGLRMLADGGSAVDAAIATAIALDGGGAGLQRHRLRRLRHCVGWSATARAERVGTLARRMDARVFRRRRRSGARLEFRHRPGRGVGVGGAARQVRKAPFRAALRAGNLLRKQGVPGLTDDRGAVGGASPAVRVAARIRRNIHAAAVEHRARANWSHCPTTPPRSKRSPRPTARRSTEENWRPNSRPTRRPTAGPCGPATSPHTMPTGSAPSPAATAGTQCTRYRPTVRASLR